MSDPEARPLSGWADGVWLDDKNWQFTVGYFRNSGECVIYERRSNFKTEHNSATAMEAAFQRMLKFLENAQQEQ